METQVTVRPFEPADLEHFARTTCPECGAHVHWIHLKDLRKHRPEAPADAEDLIPNGDAWVCSNCSMYGIASPVETFGSLALGDETEDDELCEQCEQCGAYMDFVDPASVAYSHRERFLAAKKAHGAHMLLEHCGALVCGQCGTVEFEIITDCADPGAR